MTNLTRAHRELFRRTADEGFDSLASLAQHCRDRKHHSTDRWQPPHALSARSVNGSGLVLAAGDDGPFHMTDWSFGQLCRLAGVSKETVNRLSPDTAGRVFGETWPTGNKPLQLFTQDTTLRSVHGAAYTRLHDADCIDLLQEVATDFQPPQKAVTGGTGLYAGEQDMFCFLIDPLGWTEIEGEAFAPGFYLWNSEVGRRSFGVETFWFQAVCANHIVWDAVEVVEFSRKHTANVHESLGEIRRIIEALVAKRDQRKDAFARVVRKAMETRLGDDAEEVEKVLAREGISRGTAKLALDIARQQGRFTIFALVDALTRVAQQVEYAGERTLADQRAGALLALAV